MAIHGPWVIGHPAKFSVDMRSSPADCNLNAWVDFNANGSWDAGEQIAADVLLAAGSIHHLGFGVPAFPVAVPRITYARFRCSSQLGLGSGRRSAMTARWRTTASNCWRRPSRRW